MLTDSQVADIKKQRDAYKKGRLVQYHFSPEVPAATLALIECEAIELFPLDDDPGYATDYRGWRWQVKDGFALVLKRPESSYWENTSMSVDFILRLAEFARASKTEASHV